MALSDTAGLLFKVRADSDQARAEMNKLRNAFDTDVKAIEKGGTNAFLKLGESAGLSTSQMASLSKALPLVAIGITAIAGAAAAAAVGLFSLVKASADYGSTIFDAAEKTGLSTETLSALKFAADQSNSSLDQLANGVKIFSKTVADAARGSEEATEKLKRLGIDPQEAIKDLEGALAKTFKVINDAPEGIEQTSAAMDAFGSRMGPDMIGTIKSFDGDLNKLMGTVGDLGGLMDKESAKMAEDFSDAFDKITSQAKFTGFVIAKEFMPEITQAMAEISKFVIENKDTFREWGTAVADLVRGVRGIMNSEAVGIIGSIVNIMSYLNPFTQALRAALFLLKQIGLASENLPSETPSQTYGEDPYGPGARNKAGSQATSMAASTYRMGGPKGTGSRGSRGGGAKKETDEDRALKLLKQLEDQAAKTTATTELARVSLKLLEKGYLGVTDATRHSILMTAKANDMREAKAASDKKLATAHEMFVAFIKKQIETTRELAGIERTATDEVDAFVESLKKLGVVLAPSQVELMKFTAIGHGSAAAIERNNQAMQEMWELQNAMATQGALPGGSFGIDPNAPAGAMGAPPPGGGVDWEALTSTIADTLGTSTGVIREFGNMATQTFSNIAQGVGQAYEAFILFGTGGEGIKKFAARMIASLAAMAATNAVFEVAMGLSKLALNYFWPDPALTKSAAMHFSSAAAFGLVAGVAGIAGRALAGNSFAGGGGGGNAGAKSSAAAAGGQPGAGGAARDTNVIDLERNRPAPIDVNVRVDLRTNDAHIIDSVVSNVNNDGRLRKMIVGMVEG